MQRQHITLNQIQDFESVDLKLFKQRIEKAQAEQRRWFADRLNLYSAIQRQLQTELVWTYRR